MKKNEDFDFEYKFIRKHMKQHDFSIGVNFFINCKLKYPNGSEKSNIYFHITIGRHVFIIGFMNEPIRPLDINKYIKE